MIPRMNLWKTQEEPAEVLKPRRLRKLYEREPDAKPVPVAAPTEPANTTPAASTLEAGSWEQPVAVPLTRKEEPPGDRRKGKRPYTKGQKNKVRRHAVSVSVSEEEEDILRVHAAKLDMSFSAWARLVLFRALGRKPPPRGEEE